MTRVSAPTVHAFMQFMCLIATKSNCMISLSVSIELTGIPHILFPVHSIKPNTSRMMWIMVRRKVRLKPLCTSGRWVGGKQGKE